MRLGDAIKRMTTTMGLEQCEPCRRRQRKLNALGARVARSLKPRASKGPTKKGLARAIYRLTLGSIFARRRRKITDARRYEAALERLYILARDRGWLREAERASEDAHNLAGAGFGTPRPRPTSRAAARRRNTR